MTVIEQRTHKTLDIQKYWQEKILNLDTNKVEHCIVGTCEEDIFPAMVILARYDTKEQCNNVYNELWRKYNANETYTFPKKEEI